MISKIPEETLQKWQNIVNILAKIGDVPVALIMKQNPPEIEVFKASNTQGNPYKEGGSERLNGLYCERVIKTKKELLIPNALKDDEWKENPDIELGMISYLGYPIILPNGKVFGTICILDKKENTYSKQIKNLMCEFKDLIESHLELVHKNKLLKKAKKKYRRAYKRSDLYKNFLIHDVNNILQNLSLSVGILRDARKKKILNEQKVSKVLDILEQDVINGKNLISNIQILSKRPKENSNIKEIEFFGILEKVINQIVEMYTPNSLDIKLLTETPINKIYVTASELLSNALKNILLNAIKHNDNPIKKIRIKCSIVEESQDKFLKAEIVDNGIGILEKRKKIIFEHDIFQEEKKKGLGIGLSLVHKLITSYGGKIWVENRVKNDYTQGSNFTLLLPIVKKNNN